MKKNKGYIMSTYVYMILVFFLLFMITLILVMNNNKLLQKKIKNQISDKGITEYKAKYAYTGDYQTFIAPYTGTYKLEVWGASGGYKSDAQHGGYGGYSKGEVKLNKGDILYIVVGGEGTEQVGTGAGNPLNCVDNDGYNGGGKSSAANGSHGGGGATHIANTLEGTGVLSNYESKRESVLIVAGGGGGYNGNIATAIGGSGGGIKGGIGTTGSIENSGSQTAGGTGQTASGFGQAGGGNCGAVAAPGGGGGYYGGSGAGNKGGGGGGSGYIGNSKLTNKVMYCYNCEESSEINTKTISINESGKHEENKANEGNGYAIITYIQKNDNEIVDEEEPEYEDLSPATDELIAKLGECGLYQDSNGDYRYAGLTVDACNNVSFNGQTWKIVGIFDVAKTVGGETEKRIKLVGSERTPQSLINFNWPEPYCEAYNSTCWHGDGTSTWSKMSELFGLDNNRYYNDILDAKSQLLVDDATWHQGIISNNISSSTTTKAIYNYERAHNEIVLKVGTLYLSDYGYAASSSDSYHIQDANSSYSWLSVYSYFTHVIDGCGSGNWLDSSASCIYGSAISFAPSVYLKADVGILKGDGTPENPYVFAPKKSVNLIPGYKEVEYIESTGTQYIDTEYYPTEDTRFETNVGYTVTGSNSSLFGVKTTTGESTYKNSSAVEVSPGNYSKYKLTTYFGNDKASQSGFDDIVYKLTLNHGLSSVFSGIYENSSFDVSYNGGFTSDYSAYIFAINQDGSPVGIGNTKIYSFRMYEDGALVRDFIPCYRKSDGEIGLYDNVEKKFYTNAGTGVFLKGNDV